MKPVSPVIPGADAKETVYGGNQPEYLDLPAIQNNDADGMITTRWQLTWLERVRVLISGNLWLHVLTFRKPLQPLKITTKCPELESESSQ